VPFFAPLTLFSLSLLYSTITRVTLVVPFAIFNDRMPNEPIELVLRHQTQHRDLPRFTITKVRTRFSPRVGQSKPYESAMLKDCFTTFLAFERKRFVTACLLYSHSLQATVLLFALDPRARIMQMHRQLHCRLGMQSRDIYQPCPSFSFHAHSGRPLICTHKVMHWSN
jgi:hypothetical protein